MEEQVISVGFGKENFKTQGMSLGAFQVTAPWRRELPSKGLKRQSPMQVFPASQYPEINGKMFIDTLRAPEGTLFLLQASHKLITREGRPPLLKDGAVLLRTRATGPMLTVHASLPSPEDALLSGRFLAFQGRADILTEQYMADFGLEVPTSYRESYFDPEEVAECFTSQVIAPALADKPRMETVVVGDEVHVVAARPMRRVNRRR